MKIKDLAGAFIAVAICLSAGAIGSIFTTPAIPTWYAGLNKPFFNPPNWIFAPVWTTLYIMMGIAAHLVSKELKKNEEAAKGLAVFSVQLILNAVWSVVFFGAKDLFLALIVIAILWFLIALTIMQFGKVSRDAALLLYPYIVWVSFASVLNAAVWLMN